MKRKPSAAFLRYGTAMDTKHLAGGMGKRESLGQEKEHVTASAHKTAVRQDELGEGGKTV